MSSEVLTTAGYAVGNVVSSVALVLVNKKVFAAGFHFPLALSFFHFCFTIVFFYIWSPTSVKFCLWPNMVTSYSPFSECSRLDIVSLY